LGYFLGDFLRYGWFFLVHRNGDLKGFAHWARSTLAGASGRLRPYVPPVERRAASSSKSAFGSSGMGPYPAAADGPESQHCAPMPRSGSGSETAKAPFP
jgi:hypothetical protein